MASARTLHLLDLQDDLLLRILAAVPLADRLSRASLACRRLRTLACEPQLLHDGLVQCPASVPALRTFLPWLAQRAAHMRRLSIDVPADPEAAAILASCLALCGAIGQLQHLQIYAFAADAALPTWAWLPCMRSLRTLVVHGGKLRLSADASGLPALDSMQLTGGSLVMEPGARLPAALTSLVLTSFSVYDAVMPQQVSMLTRLQHLRLFYCKYSTSSMECLSCLTGLTSFDCHSCKHAPPRQALCHLTALRTLHLLCFESLADQLGPALPALRQLTRLAALATDPMPPAVTALRKLQQLWWFDEGPPFQDVLRGVLQNPVLPLTQPHSLTRLRLLAIHWLTAAASLPALAGMPALADLRVYDVQGTASVPQPQWEAFWAFLQRHPPLRRLRVYPKYRHPVDVIRQQCAQLQAARPALAVLIEEVWAAEYLFAWIGRDN